MAFKGTYTALVTPFTNGEFDQKAFEKLIEDQIQGGVDGIVPVGTTGESPTVSMEEHAKIVEIAVKIAQGKIKVIAGTGANSTEEAIHLTRSAEKAGADGSLQVAPYYNKPSQEGLYQHFSKIAGSTGLPLVLYSIPGRCGIQIDVDTVARLAEGHENVSSIKEAGGDVDRVSQLKQSLSDDFSIVSGDDALTLPFISVGAVGVISVASNIIPKEVSMLVKNSLAGDFVEAGRIHKKLYPLFKNLFIETNPVPIKTALALTGIGNEEFRLPLCKMSDSNKKILMDSLKQFEVI